jgi:hypothetical protein
MRGHLDKAGPQGKNKNIASAGPVVEAFVFLVDKR